MFGLPVLLLMYGLIFPGATKVIELDPICIQAQKNGRTISFSVPHEWMCKFIPPTDVIQRGLPAIEAWVLGLFHSSPDTVQHIPSGGGGFSSPSYSTSNSYNGNSGNLGGSDFNHNFLGGKQGLPGDVTGGSSNTIGTDVVQKSLSDLREQTNRLGMLVNGLDNNRYGSTTNSHANSGSFGGSSFGKPFDYYGRIEELRIQQEQNMASFRVIDSVYAQQKLQQEAHMASIANIGQQSYTQLQANIGIGAMLMTYAVNHFNTQLQLAWENAEQIDEAVERIDFYARSAADKTNGFSPLFESALKAQVDERGLIKRWSEAVPSSKNLIFQTSIASDEGKFIRHNFNRALFIHVNAERSGNIELREQTEVAMGLLISADALSTSPQFSYYGKHLSDQAQRMLDYHLENKRVETYNQQQLDPRVASELGVSADSSTFFGHEIILAANRFSICNGCLADENIQFQVSIWLQNAHSASLGGDSRRAIEAVNKVHQVADYLKGTGKGLFNFFVDTVTGIQHFVLHPIDSTSAIADAVKNYDRTYDIIHGHVAKIIDEYPSYSAIQRGELHARIGAEILSAVLPIGSTKNLAKAARLSEAVIEVSAIETATSVNRIQAFSLVCKTEFSVSESIASYFGSPTKLTIELSKYAGVEGRIGVLSDVTSSDGYLKLSKTVSNQLNTERGFIPVQAILETIGSGNRVPDPKNVPGHFMYSIKSSYTQGEGVLEVLVDESVGQIDHVGVAKGVEKSNTLETGANSATSANAKEALDDKLRGLQKAQEMADRTEVLPDGRVRYYSKEVLAQKEGPTRGASYVTEHNPANGQTRSWMESYGKDGSVTRVHPKTIDGQPVESHHYPPTAKELLK